MRGLAGPVAVRTRLTLWYTAILLAILVLISGLSYSLLRWSLLQDLDTSLLTVATVIRDTGGPGAPEADLRDILGPEFYDKFFRLLDPEGHPAPSTALHERDLPLSGIARHRARRGQTTYETARLPDGEEVRLVTMPVVRDGQLTELIQVGIGLQRARRALSRYVDTLLVLVPLGVVLAGVGGAAIARTALRPVDEMSRAARRIGAEDLSRRVPLRGTGDELDRLADTLNAMLARLDEAFHQVRRFAADAAHELRTPLTVLQGEMQVALRAERSSEEYRRVLASGLEEVEHLIRLAEDLLLLSRFTAAAPPPRERVDLEPLVMEAFEIGVRLAHGRGVAVRLEEAAPAAVTGDGGALRRALLNLVENAVKYTPGGGAVTLSLTVADGRARVGVSDTGIGMAPEEIAQIFEPFVRLDNARARDTGGSGLGLAIARSIARAHNGDVTVTSRPGAGSRFVIDLPLASVSGGVDGLPDVSRA